MHQFIDRAIQAWRNPQNRWIGLFILLGCLLRLVWAEDMKWKDDEIWMYATAHGVVEGRIPWPWLGMGNGVGFANPGLSIWCFIGLAWLSPDPVTMVRWVQVSNIVAIVLFAGFVRRYVVKAEQPVWLWGLAIASVNPLAIHFSRAIWATDILPLVGFFVFVGHWFRQKPWGAFVWGLVGTLIGQIHMSGFFWQGSLVLWSLWQRGRSPAKIRWGWWGLGTAIAGLPMLPWIKQIGMTAATIDRPSWAEILTPNFHLHWLITGWGLNLEDELGRVFWQSFWLEPRIFGWPSFGVAIALLCLLGQAIAPLISWVKNRRMERPEHLGFWAYSWAGGIVMPLLLLLARVRIPTHYLIVLYPFIYVWVAGMLRGRARSLIAVCWAQLFLSVCFLVFIHIHNGCVDGNYGLVYRLHPLQNP